MVTTKREPCFALALTWFSDRGWGMLIIGVDLITASPLLEVQCSRESSAVGALIDATKVTDAPTRHFCWIPSVIKLRPNAPMTLLTVAPALVSPEFGVPSLSVCDLTAPISPRIDT